MEAVTLQGLGVELQVGSARGRKAQPLAWAEPRELTREDLAGLLAEPSRGMKTPSIKRLRAVHHTIARLMADGMKQVEIGLVVGYDESRISVLKSDPAFMELIEFYRTQKDAQYVDVHARLAQLGLHTIEELQERLDEAPDKFTSRELFDLAALVLDRSSAPKKTTGQTPGTQVGAAQPAVQITFVQAGNGQRPDVIDGQSIEIDADRVAEVPWAEHVRAPTPRVSE